MKYKSNMKSKLKYLKNHPRVLRSNVKAYNKAPDIKFFQEQNEKKRVSQLRELVNLRKQKQQNKEERARKQEGVKSNTDSNRTENYAYHCQQIENPQTTVVQHQVLGNEVKMFVKSLITFELPAKDCTVQELLTTVIDKSTYWQKEIQITLSY